MQTAPRGSETSGFLKSDGRIYQGERAFANGGTDRPDGHDKGGVFSNDGNLIQTTPFSAGYGLCGSCQTAVFYIFFLAVYLTTSICSFIKLYDEDDTYEEPSGCTAEQAGKVISGEHGDHAAHCCPDSGNHYACHVFFDFEAHINTAFVLCAVLPLIAILVGSIYYGFWWKPMTSLNGFHATLGTVFYAHLIVILMCTGVIYYWMSESDGYNYTIAADVTTGIITKTPIGVNDGRTNAVKNDDQNGAFGFLFVANALILAGTIAFPLTGLALDNVDKKELRNKDIFKTAYPPGA